jgi:hypothetical protein
MIAALMFWNSINWKMDVDSEVYNALFDGFVIIFLATLFRQLNHKSAARKDQNNNQ